jgi:hypothetical protein
MAYTFTGAATLFGTTGTVNWSGIGSSSSYDVSGWTLTRSQPVNKLKSGAGKTVGLVIDPEVVWQMDIDLVIKADTLAHAADNILIAGPGTVVTLSNFPAPTGDSDLINCGNWRMLDGPKVTASTDSEVKISISVEQILGSDVKTATQLTTTIN